MPRVQHGITVEDTGDTASYVVDPTDKEAWSMQFFRSIDTTSAEGVPTTHDQAYSMGFSSGACLVSSSSLCCVPECRCSGQLCLAVQEMSMYVWQRMQAALSVRFALVDLSTAL